MKPLHILTLLLCIVTAARAADYTVNTPFDSGSYLTGTGSGTAGNLRYCIAQANANPGSTITIEGLNVMLNGELPPITAGMLIQAASNSSISGLNASRLFFIDAPGATVTIQNILLRDARAKGGDGGLGSGGGGMGAGAAVFVNAGATVLNNVQVQNVSAQGGAGGGYANGKTGGGGGLSGNGGSSNGGGGGFRGAGGSGGLVDGGINGTAGGGGGGMDGSGANGGFHGGGGGGGTTNGNGRIGGGGGGDGGTNYTNKNGLPGGFYGGGGGAGSGQSVSTTGGAGGRFGGGGGSSTNSDSNAGAGGEFGGGGGAAFSGGGLTPGARGGAGGYGAGGGGGGDLGGAPGFGGGSGGKTNIGGALGGGGSALGGAVFVRSANGASLRTTNTSLPAGTLTAGLGGAAAGIRSGANGQAAGSSVYFQGNGSDFEITTDDAARTIDGSIASDTGVGLLKTGLQTLTLTAANSYLNTTLNYGTLKLSGAGTLGKTTGFLATYLSGTCDLNGTSQTVSGIFGTNGGQIINNAPGTVSTLMISGGGNADFEGFLRDGGGQLSLTKTGTGSQTLRHANTHTGPTQVLGGTLILDTSFSNGPLIPVGSTLTISNATVRLTGTAYNALGQGPAVIQTGGVLSGESTAQNAHTLGLLTLQGGTLTGVNPDAQFGNFMLANTVTVMGNTASTINAPVVNIRGQRTFDVANGTASIDITISSVLGDDFITPGGLIKTGTGTLALTGASTYTGGTFINAGTIVAAKAGQFATFAAGSTVTVNNGGTLLCAGSDSLGYYDGNAKIVINTGGIVTTDGQSGQNTWLNDLTLNGGTLTSLATGGSFLLAGPVKTTAAATTAIISAKNIAIYPGYTTPTSFDVAPGTTASGIDLQISSIISGGGGEPLIKSGNGTLLLSAPNTYQGGTQLAGGTLAFSHPDALGTGPITFANGFLRYVGITTDVSARIQPSTGAPIRIDTNGQNVTFASPLTGSGNLGKSGAGTLTLAAANTYTGDTNVNAGNVSLAQPTLADTAAVSIAAGSTLNLAFTGTDTVNKLTFAGVQQIAGVYKAIGNPALGTATAAITGPGLIRVLSSPPGNDYGVWTAATGVAGSITDDDDRDGVINRDEYAFGLTPTSAASRNPLSAITTATGQLTYTRRTASLSGLTFTVHASADLATWAADLTATQTITSTDGDIESVRVILSPALLAGRRLFVQIRTN